MFAEEQAFPDRLPLGKYCGGMDSDGTAVQLRRTIIHLARKFNASATDEGLTPSQASTLALVAATEAMPIAEIARIDSLNPTMVSRIVSVLESKALVERRRDPADQRAFLVVATDRGAELDERIREQRVAAIRQAADALDPQDRALIERSIGALDALADAMP